MADEPKTEEKKEKSKSAGSKNIEKLVDEISQLSVMELSELVNTLQDKLGVSAMPMATSNVANAAASEQDASAAASDAGGATNLILTNAGGTKIAVIKALREINQNWGLKEAKDMTEAVPAEVIKGGKPEEVKDAAEKLKAAGATVEMK